MPHVDGEYVAAAVGGLGGGELPVGGAGKPSVAPRSTG